MTWLALLWQLAQLAGLVYGYLLAYRADWTPRRLAGNPAKETANAGHPANKTIAGNPAQQTMSTAETTTPPTVPTVETMQAAVANRATRWLFGQEAPVVLLTLILATMVLAVVFVYRDYRSDMREMRALFAQQIEKEREASTTREEKTRELMADAFKELGSSIDRLAQEVGRTRN